MRIVGLLLSKSQSLNPSQRYKSILLAFIKQDYYSFAAQKMKNMWRPLAFLFLALFILGQCDSVVGDCDGNPEGRLELLSRESFPEGFFFGTATSAYQVEGMASKAGRGPSIIAGNSTGEVAVDEYHRYKVKK
ncbi:hypothetical protein ACLOJK_026068 [Asimina triloba]